MVLRYVYNYLKTDKNDTIIFDVFSSSLEYQLHIAFTLQRIILELIVIVTIYYSKIFPPYYDRQNRLLAENPTYADTFTHQYKTMLALHSIFLENEKANTSEPDELEKTERD